MKQLIYVINWIEDMGACVVIILWGEVTALMGALHKKYTTSFMSQSSASFGRFAGFFIGESIFAFILLIWIGYFFLTERFMKQPPPPP